MLRFTLALLAAVATPAAARANAADGDILVVARPLAPFEQATVPDRDLATMRGGLDLANGLAIAIGIDVQTRVDGALLLHTLFTSDGPDQGVRVYTDGTAPTRPVPGTVTVTTPGVAATPAITIARSPSGTIISTAPQVNATSVSIVDAPQETWATGEGQARVPVVVDGGVVTTGPGSFSLQSTEGGVSSTLQTADLQVTHLLGQMTGAVIANTANDRIINTVSTVNVDLLDVDVSLAGAMFVNEALALDIVRGR